MLDAKGGGGEVLLFGAIGLALRGESVILSLFTFDDPCWADN